LGRSPKETEENREELRENDEQLKKYQNMRSGTEGKSGQSKNFYGLNQIAARLEQTGISRIMAVFTGVNLNKSFEGSETLYFLAYPKISW